MRGADDRTRRSTCRCVARGAPAPPGRLTLAPTLARAATACAKDRIRQGAVGRAPDLPRAGGVRGIRRPPGTLDRSGRARVASTARTHDRRAHLTRPGPLAAGTGCFWGPKPVRWP